MKTHSARDSWALALDPLKAELGLGAGDMPLLNVRGPSLELCEFHRPEELTGVRTKYCPRTPVGHHVGPLATQPAERMH